MPEDPEHKEARQVAVKRAMHSGRRAPPKPIGFGGGASRGAGAGTSWEVEPEPAVVAPPPAPVPVEPESPMEDILKRIFGSSQGGDTGDTGDTGDAGDTGDTGEPEYMRQEDPLDYIARRLHERTHPFESWIPPQPEAPPLEKADDYAHYQGKYIYGNPDVASKMAGVDLTVRLNSPEEVGTTSSSEHLNWNGTGWTMHEVIGEDRTRHFLENPGTAEVYNLTGHPDAERE
jgi:hypothetical protein